MHGDLAKLLVALALIGASAWLAVATASPAGPVSPAEDAREPRAKMRRRSAPPVISGAAPPPDAGSLALPAAPASTRPRIFTGEPVSTAPGSGTGRRALRLVVGITVLAAAGAVGLLVFVRAIVELFQRIGG